MIKFLETPCVMYVIGWLTWPTLMMFACAVYQGGTLCCARTYKNAERRDFPARQARRGGDAGPPPGFLCVPVHQVPLAVERELSLF